MTPTRARFLANLSLALAASAALALPVVVGPAHAQEVTQPDRCRAQLSKANRRYVDRVLDARLKCQNKMMDGKLALATDCLFGRGDDRLDKQLRKYEARLSNSGRACNGVNLQLLGFPGVCTDSTGAPFDTTDFQECVIDQTDDTLDALLDVYFPPITKYYRDNEYLCLAGAPQDGAKSLSQKMAAREKCLVGQDFGLVDSQNVECRALILPYGGGTGDERTDGAVGRAYDALLGAVPPACADIEIDELDYQSDCVDETGGVFTVLDLKRCFFDANRNAALAVLRITFPEAGVCGDGIKSGDEECDDGIAGNSDTTPNACRTDCTNPTCHDGVTDNQFGEQCDDGNLSNDDCCVLECQQASCGDGFEGCGEQCDDGAANANEPDKCRATGPHACQNPKCGDGIEDTLPLPEECDDGNSASEDGCSSLCFIESCGDEIVQEGLGEQCDNGVDNANEPDKCRATGDFACKNPTCGDEIVDTGEVCDDGNTIDGDGCDSTCAICGDGIKAAAEECDGDGSVCGAGEGCNVDCECEEACPSVGELVLWAGYGETCDTNADCEVGTCDDESGRCRTRTRLDSGWNGLAHDADINDQVRTRAFLECDGNGPVCGECSLAGIDPSPRNCRCANDIRTICNEPFVADNDDCGGATCNCYFGAPFPLASGGTPACILNRFTQAPEGTANVDEGSGTITARLRTQVFLGIDTTFPCPYCGGTCSNSPTTLCNGDVDCDGGTCNMDPIPDDGVRGGTCIATDPQVPFQSCDVMGTNASFPAYPLGTRPGGGGYSLDCAPPVGKNISGQGIIINLTQTTGTSELVSQVSCQQAIAPDLLCPCMLCSSDPSLPCNSNADCAEQQGVCSLGTGSSPPLCNTNADCDTANAGSCPTLTKRCQFATSVRCETNADCASVDVGDCEPSVCTGIGQGDFPLPNNCEDFLCTDQGGGVGECTTGPDALFCDGVLKANGKGILACQFNADCTATGINGGTCTLAERSGCFLEPIVVSGDPDPSQPVGVSAFCIPPTPNSGINSAAGLPGPGRIVNQATAKTFCGNDTTKQYQPGVGGCIETAPPPLPKNVVDPVVPAGKGASTSHGR